jgi:hypothetical protein
MENIIHLLLSNKLNICVLIILVILSSIFPPLPGNPKRLPIPLLIIFAILSLIQIILVIGQIIVGIVTHTISDYLSFGFVALRIFMLVYSVLMLGAIHEYYDYIYISPAQDHGIIYRRNFGKSEETKWK